MSLRHRSAFCLLTLACVVGLFLASCATVKRTVIAPPEMEGATFVGNKACLDCHTNITRVFALSPHGRFYKDDPKWAGMTGCESCHGPGSRHVGAGGGRGKFIVNPRKDPSSCFQCHVDVQAEFSLPHHHPVAGVDQAQTALESSHESGRVIESDSTGHFGASRMNCVECHDPHGRDIRKSSSGLAMARLNESCAQCHREQTRPFAFEHEALREGCTVCHNPHGSINAKMLVERDNNLCLKCHAQVQLTSGALVIGKLDHTSFIRRGACWSAGCHSAVHGSNINPRMLY